MAAQDYSGAMYLEAEGHLYPLQAHIVESFHTVTWQFT